MESSCRFGGVGRELGHQEDRGLLTGSGGDLGVPVEALGAVRSSEQDLSKVPAGVLILGTLGPIESCR